MRRQWGHAGQLIALPLKTGSRPPILLDVLRSARQIGGGAQLVVEVKPGNSDVAEALCTPVGLQIVAPATIKSYEDFFSKKMRKKI